MQLSKLKPIVKKNLSPGSFLTLHIVLGFLLLLICSLIFASIAEDVVTNQKIVQFDSAIVNAIHINSDPPLLHFLRLISLPAPQIRTMPTAFLAILFRWKSDGI